MKIKTVIKYTAWLKKHMTVKEINGHRVWINVQDCIDWSICDDGWLVAEFKRMENEEVMETLKEIINGDCYRISDDGRIVWRSSMDAGSRPPEFLGEKLEEILKEWLIEYAYEEG